ncbi:MAG: hypothetical protein KAS96_11260, partial [Planctomycetes bacterium]|nr:hypothetical protein [Planctomycetota bacterium]
MKKLLMILFLIIFATSADILASEKATDPDPEDGAMGVTDDYAIYMYWTPSESALSHDVYVGADYNDVNDATTESAEFILNTARPQYAFIDYADGTEYFWRIDTVTDSTTVKGDVWTFITWAFPNTDLNDDSFVDIHDFKILVYDWLDDLLGNSDINKDKIVNFKDYSILLDNWYEGDKYYFDSVGGNDNNAGTSPDQAWQSLSKFNNTTFFPRDKIYFKAGSQYNGQITPKGSGSAKVPITIDAYGDITDANDKPRFDGNGTGTTLYIHHVEYWQINNLQLTNYGATAGDWRTA